MDEYRTVFLMLLVAMSNYVVAVQLHYIYFSEFHKKQSLLPKAWWNNGKVERCWCYKPKLLVSTLSMASTLSFGDFLCPSFLTGFGS